MTTSEDNHSAGSAEIETAASQACTRSGTFALLLAVVLFLLSAYWVQEKNPLAAAQYTAHRNTLTIHLETLDEDPLWQSYKQRNPEAEDTAMSALFHAAGTVTQNIGMPTTTGTGTGGAAAPPLIAPSAIGRKSSAQSQQHVAPAPPTNITVTTSFTNEPPEMAQVREDLELLNDSQMLTRARQASNFFELSIIRWVSKVGTTVYANDTRGISHAPVLELPAKSRPTHYTPQFDKKALMDCLTLRNVRDLATFELPVFTNPDSMMRHAAQEVEMSPGSLPKDPYMATITAQLLLFLVLTYFAAFTRESASSETFPLRGTLFGVFSRSGWMTVVFFLALWTPFAACCAVLIASPKATLSIGLIPVALVTLFVQRTLEKTSFFGSVKPLTFLAEIFSFRKLRKTNGSLGSDWAESGGSDAGH